MNHLDTLYRALIDYRKNTLDSRECKTQRKAIVSANSEEDFIEITRKNCIVEEDWIEAIENGLQFIEKAIKEERQFIRSNGEVVPIEKVKRTSKDSVEHLARHSNLFTREPNEGEDMIPDQLYTVERLSDYAVYENRFLYMLLCYLRDFIGMRYEKIVELTNTYKGNMTMNKAIVESNRRITYEVRLEEERKNDDYLREHNSAQSSIDRILTIYKAVSVYLATPLMIEVSKSPMLKPPIVRTNVLKMNRNFREAMKLYEFVVAYDRDGYEIKTDKKTVSPFVGGVGDEIAETVELSLFLTYEHGLGIKDYFKENYEKEEERRRREEAKKLAEQIKNVGRNLKESGMSPEEYILLLQRRIRDLEKSEEKLVAAEKTIEKLQAELDHYKAELAHAQDTVRSLGEEIVRLNQKYIDDMNAAELKHLEHVKQLNEEHEQYVASLQEEHERYVTSLREEHESEVAALNEAHTEEIRAINAAHEEAIGELESRIERLEEEKRAEEERHRMEIFQANEAHAAQVRTMTEEHALQTAILNGKIAEGVTQLKELNKQYVALEEEKTLAEARLNALRSEYGLMTAEDDFTSREKSGEIEHQYKVFKKFYRGEWRKTKRKIWQDVFAYFKRNSKGENPDLENALLDAQGEMIASEEKETDSAATEVPSTQTEETQAEAPQTVEIEESNENE